MRNPLLGVVLAGALIVGAAARAEDKPAAGDAFGPVLEVQQAATGGSFNPYEASGGVLVVHLVQLGRDDAAARAKAVEAIRAAVTEPGVKMVGASLDDAAALRQFAKDAGVGFPLVVLKPGVFDELRGLEPRPAADTLVVGPSGHVTWRGPASGLGAADVRSALAGAVLLPKVGSTVAAARAKAEKGNWGPALTDLEKLLARTNLPVDDRTEANNTKAWVLSAVIVEMKRFTALVEAGRISRAIVQGERLAGLAKGAEAGNKASDLAEKLRGTGEKITRSRDADTAYTRAEAKALALVRTEGSASGAIPDLEAVAKSFSGEKVAKLAAEMAERIRAAGPAPAPPAGGAGDR